MNEPTVHIVDDDEAVRDSVSTLLQGAGFTCETHASARRFLESGSLVPGCAMIDMRMPEMDGLTVLRELTARRRRIAVIIMTGFGDVPLAVTAMKEGAVDFIEKPVPRDVLVDAVRRALSKAQQTRSTAGEKQEAIERFKRLTDRERDVLEHLVEGDANKIIAHKLGISPRTVEIHRANMLNKMGANHTSEAIRIAIEASLVG